jgi:NADH dehydrogenase
VLHGCDGLVYTASVSTGPNATDRTEPEGLANIAAACQAASVSRLVFFSGLGLAHYGMNPHCTNPYFLAKMAGEVALFRSPLAITVFRPSYIFGAGDEFLTPLIRRVASSATIEVPGDGLYRLQPVSVRDTSRAVASALAQSETDPRVVDLVGPEILSYRALTERVAAILGRSIEVTERPVAEALAQARRSGYFGLRPHDLACLLCDEVSDSGPIESLVGQPLESVGSMIAQAVDELGSSGLNA